MSKLSSKVDERPAMQFYLKDWLADTRILNLAERGLWIDALAFMFRAPRRGYLIMQNGCKPDTEALRNMFGTQNGEAEAVLDRILAKGVASRDGDGVIYCRRMAREADTEERKSELGRAAAEARWNAERMRNDGPPTPTPSPTPSPSPKELGFAPGKPDAGDALTEGHKPLIPKPDPKPRTLTAHQENVKACLNSYAEAYAEAFGKQYPSSLNEKAPRVAKWLKGQIPAGAIGEWRQACIVAVKAYKLDATFHPFPATIPKMCEAIPKLNGAWLDGARANAHKPKRADPERQALLDRARRCMNSGDGCPGVDPKNPACAVCARGVKGSKL